MFRVLFVAILLFGHAASNADDSKCYLIVAADTDSNLGQSVKTDVSHITDIFKRNLRDDRLVLTDQAQGNNFTSQQIIKLIKTMRNIGLTENDTLVVYIAGHGAYDPDRGQYIQTQNGTIMRSDLRREMLAEGARLSVLITDTCSVVVKVNKGVAAMAIDESDETSPGFDSLFLRPRGFVDMSGSSRGEVAMGNSLVGGFFTSELCNSLWSAKQHELAWGSLHNEVRNRVRKLFRESFSDGYLVRLGDDEFVQRTQTVFADIAINENAGQRYRFGVRVKEINGSLIVTQVIPGAPGSLCAIEGIAGNVTLEKGDQIVEINGRKIESESEYAEAIDNSPQQMSFSVINTKDGALYRARVLLGY